MEGVFLKVNKGGETNVMLRHLHKPKEDRNYMSHRHKYPKKLKQALKNMKNSKAVGLDNILIEG